MKVYLVAFRMVNKGIDAMYFRVTVVGTVFTNHRVNLDPGMADSTLRFIAKTVPEQMIYCELDP